MSVWRILIDDTDQGRTQRAVLKAFAATVPAGIPILWSSGLPPVVRWRDAPAISARRIAAHAAALAPDWSGRTLFIPSHVVPAEGARLVPPSAEAPLPSWVTVADLDVFVADNAGPCAALFARHRETNPDYQSCSSFGVVALAAQPVWTGEPPLTQSLLLTQRPWYSANVPSRVSWLAWVLRALREGHLALSDVEEDARELLVRPSLVEEVRVLLASGEVAPHPDLTLDTLFIAPEGRLMDAQYAMLHSRALQERTVRFHRQEVARKLAEAALPAAGRASRQRDPLWRRAARRARNAARRLVKLAYLGYSVTLRPLVRGAGRTKSGR